MSLKLTYGDFTKTGWQDCGNVFDPRDHYEAWRRLGKPRSTNAARAVVREAWGDDDEAREQWLKQADVGDIIEDGLDPRLAYKAWRDAWQDCAESAVKADIEDWIARDEEAGHATIAQKPRTPAQDQALRIAQRQGHVYAGWNPGVGGRVRVSANVLRALERSGLLVVSKTSAGELIGTLTRAGAAAIEEAP